MGGTRTGSKGDAASKDGRIREPVAEPFGA